jgi:hypothetical protein
MKMDFDYEQKEVVDELIKSIEAEYGKSVVRIAYLEATDDPYIFDIKVIFTDFRLLDGHIVIRPMGDIVTVRIVGTYY